MNENTPTKQKIMVVQDGVCKFGKQSKERITVFLCGSMMGEKYNAIVIGKSECPRNIDLIKKLPLQYKSNSKAWMTGEVFYEVISKFNNFNKDRNRFALLFLDNCSAHPQQLAFSNVKLCFLPPNATSVLQPMDAGVIKCFKGHYKIKFARRAIHHLEKDNFSKQFKPTLINLFESLEMLCSAWNEVKKETISNCFRHCGFFQAKCLEEPLENEISCEFNELKTEFKLIHPDLDLSSYVEADNQLQTSEPFIENIPATRFLESEISTDICEEDQTNDVEGGNEIVERYELFQIIDFLQKIKIFGLQSKNETSKLEILGLCNKLESSLTSHVAYKQLDITQFFN